METLKQDEENLEWAKSRIPSWINQAANYSGEKKRSFLYIRLSIFMDSFISNSEDKERIETELKKLIDSLL